MHRRNFCNYFLALRWSIMHECESDLIFNRSPLDRECKRLSNERIDDHTPK
jgi:hypothetical protein